MAERALQRFSRHGPAPGPKAIETYTKRFPISPALIDRVTLFGIAGPAEQPQAIPPPFVVVSLNRAVDEAKVVGLFLPDAQTESVGGKNVFVANGMCIYPIDQKTFVVSARIDESLLDPPKAADGPMAAAKERAAKHHVALAVNVSAIPRVKSSTFRRPFSHSLKLRSPV